MLFPSMVYTVDDHPHMASTKSIFTVLIKSFPSLAKCGCFFSSISNTKSAAIVFLSSSPPFSAKVIFVPFLNPARMGTSIVSAFDFWFPDASNTFLVIFNFFVAP